MKYYPVSWNDETVGVVRAEDGLAPYPGQQLRCEDGVIRIVKWCQSSLCEFNTFSAAAYWAKIRWGVFPENLNVGTTI